MRSRGKPIVQFDHRSTSKKVGARLKAMRIKLELTQKEAGDILGVSFQQIQKYERGTTEISAVRLIQFCQALEVDPGTILASINASLLI
jgi:transcriptional regulator with XRE-family HTH domain